MTDWINKTAHDLFMEMVFWGWDRHWEPRNIERSEARIAAIIELRAGQLLGLEKGVREHRDARGDDRCWMDDEALYKLLPEGFIPPARDTAVELTRCQQFIASRQNPATTYVSPEREIESLRALLKESKREHAPITSIYCRRRYIDEDPCTCGADAWNARIDEALE